MFKKTTLSLLILFLLVSCNRDPAPTPVPIIQAIPTDTLQPPTATTTPSPLPTDQPSATSTQPPATSDQLPATSTPTFTPAANTPTFTPAATGIPIITILVSNANTNEPIEGASVDLIADYLLITLSETTDGSGEVSFINLATGDYPLIINATAFEPITTTTTIMGGENIVQIPLSPIPPPEIFGSVTQSRSNLRNGPGNNFDIIEKLELGTEVQVLGQTDDGDWVLVDVIGTELTGWLAINLVNTEEDIALAWVLTPEPTPTPAPFEPIPGEIRARANMRSGPGADFSLVERLEAGTQIEILRRTRDGLWVEVRTTDGLQGWVFVELVTFDGTVDDLPGITSTPPPGGGGGGGDDEPGDTSTTPTPTPISTGTLPSRPGATPFTATPFRDAIINVDNAIIVMGGALDRMWQNDDLASNCEEFITFYGQVIASPIYSDVPEAFAPTYTKYITAVDQTLSAANNIYLICTENGVLAQLAYSTTRDTFNNAHNLLVEALAEANALLGE